MHDEIHVMSTQWAVVGKAREQMTKSFPRVNKGLGEDRSKELEGRTKSQAQVCSDKALVPGGV